MGWGGQAISVTKEGPPGERGKTNKVKPAVYGKGLSLAEVRGRGELAMTDRPVSSVSHSVCKHACLFVRSGVILKLKEGKISRL